MPQPRLRWLPWSGGRGQHQTAWRVLVATSQTVSQEDRGDLWDSGKVDSDQSAHVRYAGRPPGQGQAAFWKVSLWDRDGKPGPWSEPAMLRPGRNAIGAMLGNGWYNVQYRSAWDFDNAPRRACFVHCASKWRTAARGSWAVAVTEPKPGVFVFDLGVNIAGFPELEVSGPAGTRLTMKMGERLLPDGTVDQQAIAEHVVQYDPSQQFQTDTYLLKGGGVERWHSRFTYHGFQYVEVTGLPSKPGPDTLRGIFIHGAVPEAGGIECSNPLLNRIWQTARMAYLGNLHGIPTDCPHREKNGWTGDAHLAGL